MRALLEDEESACINHPRVCCITDGELALAHEASGQNVCVWHVNGGQLFEYRLGETRPGLLRVTL